VTHYLYLIMQDIEKFPWVKKNINMMRKLVKFVFNYAYMFIVLEHSVNVHKILRQVVILDVRQT
jgi:hypothetical protein